MAREQPSVIRSSRDAVAGQVSYDRYACRFD